MGQKDPRLGTTGAMIYFSFYPVFLGTRYHFGPKARKRMKTTVFTISLLLWKAYFLSRKSFWGNDWRVCWQPEIFRSQKPMDLATACNLRIGHLIRRSKSIWAWLKEDHHLGIQVTTDYEGFLIEKPFGRSQAYESPSLVAKRNLF